MEGDAQQLAQNEDVKEFYLASLPANERVFAIPNITGGANVGWRDDPQNALPN
jgi:hypothetical protein